MNYLKAIVLVLFIALFEGALAQSFPIKPVRIILPYSSGGEGDAVLRAITARLFDKWKQPVLIDFRPGAGSIIGTDMAAKANPDGYTILFTSNGFITSQFGQQPLPYDPASLLPLARATISPLILYVNSQLPIKTLNDLVAYGKPRPRQLMFGSAGIGSSPHLTAELFAAVNGMEITHVPYKGTGPARVDLLGGRLQGYWGTSLIMPSAAETQVRAIAVANSKRLTGFPDLPTTAEMGMPGIVAASWTGFFLPAKVPAELQDRIHADLMEILNTPEFRETILRFRMESATLSREEYAAFLKGEYRKWGDLIRTRNIRIE